MTLKIGILGSTRGTDMQAVINAIEKRKLDAEIACVVSNKEDAYILERAREHGIEAIYIDHRGKEREDFDREVAKEFDRRSVELVLMIGFMRILSPWFCRHYENRLMNIHPSLLPMFAGGMDTDVHEEVLKRGCKVTGCTLHFVTEEVDGGPIILQKVVQVEDGETVDSLKTKVQKAEQEIILKAIKLFAGGKLQVDGKWVRILE